MPVTLDDLRRKAETHHDWMISARRHLHRNPEVSFKEYETTDYIISELEKLGIPTERPLKTGCVGIIEGGAKSNSDRVIDRKSTRLNSSHVATSYAVFCLKKEIRS